MRLSIWDTGPGIDEADQALGRRNADSGDSGVSGRVYGMMAERMGERFQDLAHQGKEAALETQHKIENQARQAKTTAEHCIQHAPFKSVMVAAGVGLLAGVVATWLMREPSH